MFARLLLIIKSWFEALMGAGKAPTSAGYGAAPDRPGDIVHELATLPVIVSQTSVESEDPGAVVRSNISVVNAMRSDLLLPQEIPPDALRSYWVDYYLAQVKNGGFAQFVWNSKLGPEQLRWIEEGLLAFGPRAHVDCFRRFQQRLDSTPPRALEWYLKTPMDTVFGMPLAKELNFFNEEFFLVDKNTPLVEANGAWLRQLPRLAILPIPEMETEIARRVALVPPAELQRRKADALARESSTTKIARALCKHHGVEYKTVLSGDPTFELNGKRTIAWGLSASGQRFFFAVDGATAVLFDGVTKEEVNRLRLPRELRR